MLSSLRYCVATPNIGWHWGTAPTFSPQNRRPSLLLLPFAWRGRFVFAAVETGVVLLQVLDHFGAGEEGAVNPAVPVFGGVVETAHFGLGGHDFAVPSGEVGGFDLLTEEGAGAVGARVEITDKVHVEVGLDFVPQAKCPEAGVDPPHHPTVK